jgi:biotin transport system substrate-specific component
MARTDSAVLLGSDRAHPWILETSTIIGAGLFIALCARITLPLPFTPVPLTLQNFGVLLVGLLLGSRRGFAALALYLAEGLVGLPVFNPTGRGGLLQILGPSGGYLMAYPFVAWVAGWLFERGRKSFARAAAANFAAEIVLFAGGLSWLGILTHSLSRALVYGLYWFVFAEVIKIMTAAAIASGWQRVHRSES